MGQAMIMRRGGSNAPRIPDGDAILPGNDVTTWLKCAGIDPSVVGQPTLAQVLASSDICYPLMGSANAVNYMIRSPAIMTAVLGSTIAKTAMDNTNPFINPVLSSNTSNGYVARGDTNNAEAYKITHPTDPWVGGANYQDAYTAWASLEMPFTIFPYKISVGVGGNNPGTLKYVLQASTDNATWISIAGEVTDVGQGVAIRSSQVTTAGLFKYFRIFFTTTWHYNGYYPNIQCRTLRIFGKKREVA